MLDGERLIHFEYKIAKKKISRYRILHWVIELRLRSKSSYRYSFLKKRSHRYVTHLIKCFVM